MSRDLFLHSISSSREGLVDAESREQSESQCADVISSSDIMGDIENALDYQDFDDSEQGRQLYFNDGVRRIDYILAWETTGKKMMESETARLTFHDNLKKEFLELEEDKSDPEIHFMKVHAPFDVLRRYAELLKLKVPMKEISELLKYAEQYDEQVVTTASLAQRCWRFVHDFGNKLKIPFLCNQEVFKKMSKKYKCAYVRDKEFIYEFPENHENIFTRNAIENCGLHSAADSIWQ